MNYLMVSFEGIDGAGKTSLITETAKRFRLRGDLGLDGQTVKPHTSYAPTWRDDAEKTAYVKGLSPGDQVNHFYHDFLQIHEKLSSLPRASIVLQDRWYDSMMAYQGPEDETLISFAKEYSKGLPCPQLTIYLQCSANTAAQRLAKRGEISDLELLATEGIRLQSVASRYDRLYAAEIVPHNWRWQPAARLETTYQMRQEHCRRIIVLPENLTLATKAEIAAQATMHALWTEFGS
jgi:thymidylate kinase